jgi:rhamnopyranosyl-N-acetylglucosaminyl-diphospho-decaprenol beta-1,3/1,4-galactofuranosyltransferase
MKSNVAVVIPTFNQKDAILKNIGLLKKQTIVFDIIIVDNNSTDGTSAAINEIFPDIMVLGAKNNFGGAGGYYIGARYAFEKGYDWIIMSDNDAYPASANLIEELVKNASDKIVTQPFNKYGKEHNDTILSLHYGCYSRKIIEKIGLPLFDFFLFGDDEEYSRRLKKAGFKINKLEHVFYFHEMKRTFAPARFYFFHRNGLKARFFYDKKIVFLSRSFVVLNSLIAYKIMKEDDCYFYGIQGVKHFLTGDYDNSYIEKTSKFISPLISSDIGAFKRENTDAFINISETSNKFLKMKSLRGKVNNFKNFLKLVKSKKMITESINGYEAICCSFLFNNSLIAIEDINKDKIIFREYYFGCFLKRYWLFFIEVVLHFHLFLAISIKFLTAFIKKTNLCEMNKKYDRESVDNFLQKNVNC